MRDIQAILNSMALEDKIALCSGADFWETKAYGQYGIPALFMCDGPHGLRKQENAADMLGINESCPATCFPAEATTASSWDPALLSRIGAAIGEEAKDQGVGLVLGPGANLKRNPLCGRNFEYFSEDPFLAGKLAAGFIQGIEGQDISSSLKHFAANSQETCRFQSDSVMDERTLRELYLPAFEIAVKEGKPATVMCAYPKLNGVHCSDSQALLTDILRNEWGFEGLVVTDWGAMNDRLEGFRAGCDLNMPGGSAYMEKEALQAVRDGSLPEADVDRCAGRVLRLVFHAAETKKPFACDYGANHALAKEAALAGAVLLQNRDAILPLREGEHVAVIGAMAKTMRYQGAGSSHINPTRLSQPMEYLPGVSYAAGCDERGDTTEALIAEAVIAAKTAKTAVVFAGLPGRYESEGFDRDSMSMPEGHNRLIEAVSCANPNTVVVLLCGTAVECPWADQVKGILWMGLPGQAGGEAIADLLYGRANPSGKLAETWPLRYGDCVSAPYYGKTKDALYMEGIYVGYRYYDKAGKDVRWPFGYGLSFTRFGYTDLRVDGNTVTVTVRNIGDRSGSEIVQLYMEAPQNGLHRPVRELRGFRKVTLAPGEASTVEFILTDRDFSVWQNGWVMPGGDYTVCVGTSSRNLSLRQTIHRNGTDLSVPDWQHGSFYETCAGTPTQVLLESAMGRPYTPKALQKGFFTMDNSVDEMKEFSLVMKIMYKAVEKTIAKGFGGKADYENPEFRMMMASSTGSSLRNLQTSGGLRDGIMQGMLDMANGHFCRGILKMIKG